MENTKKLRTTTWLAERLDLSVTTVEKMRSKSPEKLPPHINFGTSIRYDEDLVEVWLKEKIQGQNPAVKAETIENVEANNG
jgi:hypothetical protein